MIDTQQRHQKPVRSLLMSSAITRLAGAFAIVAMLWLGVAWALN
jgi:hypothetical protein